MLTRTTKPFWNNIETRQQRTSRQNDANFIHNSYIFLFSFLFSSRSFHFVFVVVCAQSRRKMAKSKAAAKKENLDDLKQELDIDYHKITSEELYQRFQTHPENVSSQIQSI